MDPISVIVWIVITIFGLTALAGVLALYLDVTKGRHRGLLIGTMITQIVLTCLGVFAAYFNKSAERENRLPISKLMMVEQAPAKTVFDGDKLIYLRSPDVSRAQRVVDLAIDLRSDFLTPTTVRLSPGSVQNVSVGERRYRVGYPIGTARRRSKRTAGTNWRFCFPIDGAGGIGQISGVAFSTAARGQNAGYGVTVQVTLRLYQRLQDHLNNRSSFTTKYLKGRGDRLRRKGYMFRCWIIKNPRTRALLEAYAIA